MDFERDALSTLYGAIFSIVPILLINLCVALLCANHVTQRFGKGIMPRRYRLSVKDLEVLWREREEKAPLSTMMEEDAGEEKRATLEGMVVLRSSQVLEGLGLSESKSGMSVSLDSTASMAEELTRELKRLRIAGS